LLDLNKSLELGPDDNAAYYVRAWTEFSLRDYKKASADILQFLGKRGLSMVKKFEPRKQPQ
jgi:hypothetical protein